MIMQVCMATKDRNDEKIERTYDEIGEILHQEGRGQVNDIVMKDFNSIMGEGSTNKVVGRFGLSKRSKRGKMLFNVCRQYHLVVTNTWLKKIKAKPHTWKSPGDKKRYQID